MANREEIKAEFDKLYRPFFKYEEFMCQCKDCAHYRIQDQDDGEWFKKSEFRSFMRKLMGLRSRAGFPFKINSGYRCPSHNNLVSSTGFEGPHTKGAADIAVGFERAYRLNQLASAKNLGIGTAQKGKLATRYIHVDNLGTRIWTY